MKRSKRSAGGADIRREAGLKPSFRCPGRDWVLGLVLCAAALGGCSTTAIGGAAGLDVRQGDLPPPTPADLYAQTDFAGIRPFDTLTIDVFGIEELSQRKVRVDVNGEIGFPLVGTLPVAGLTTSQVSLALAARLKGQFVRNPQVTTNLESSETSTFTVYGQVKQPGVYPVIGEGTLLKAVATARGLAEYGNSREVIVFRTVEGEKLATLYNIEAISRGAYGDPRIYPNDTIVIGDSPERRLFDDIVGVAAILAAPVTLVLTR